MQSRSVVLRNERSPKGTRSRVARVAKNGDLTIEGHDLGSGVEAVWGAGLQEYEWTIVVRAAHVPQLITALAGAPGEDLLSLLAVRCSGDRFCATRAFLGQRAILIEFWNRVGD